VTKTRREGQESWEIGLTGHPDKRLAAQREFVDNQAQYVASGALIEMKVLAGEQRAKLPRWGTIGSDRAVG